MRFYCSQTHKDRFSHVGAYYNNCAYIPKSGKNVIQCVHYENTHAQLHGGETSCET